MRHAHLLWGSIVACKKVCDRMARKRSFSDVAYGSGLKRCSVCSVYIICSSVKCPCCSSKLRTHPRNRKSKAILRKLTREQFASSSKNRFTRFTKKENRGAFDSDMILAVAFQSCNKRRCSSDDSQFLRPSAIGGG
jgi:hypothetical protein